MATIKQGPAPEDHYAMIPNAFARSSTIPSRAKTVYLYIRSHRTGWSLSTDRIADALGMSPTTIKAAIRDLEQSGWVTRTQVHGDGGMFGNCEYTVHSMPVDRGTDSVPRTVGQKTAGGLTASGKSDPHKKTIPSKKTKGEEDQPPVVPQGDKPKRRKPRHPITEDWTPRPDVVQQMAEECPGVDQAHELAQMRDHFLASAGTSTDWNLNYRKWVRNAAKWGRGGQQQGRKADQIIQAVVGLDQDRQEGRELAW
ncbi:helix-turn-helix domain-containing protein [Corynebacterium provencense]|uniref:helix-turn-helix domain-containing protein n=1 Tax=Corynebacterium provencense TaxID=1737425 RepID=UPI000832F5BF|nr:helix-turn-helix domain-containing protein [Corynebacterium provencense]